MLFLKEFWPFESNNKAESPECFIDKCVVNLSIIVVSYFIVKKCYFTFKLVFMHLVVPNTKIFRDF